MSETTPTSRGPVGHEPGPGAKELRDGQDDGDWLDREHQARVSRVASCDTEAGRKEAAEMEMGRLTEDEQYFFAERDAQGNDEHVGAIRRSGWYSYLRSIRLGSTAAWILDAVLWSGLWGGIWWLWKRYYEDAGEPVPAWLYIVGLILVPLASVLCARVTKGFGQQIAVTRLTNPMSVVNTIDTQVRLAGKYAVAAGVLVLGVMAVLFFAPSSWSSWISYLSGILAFAANITLGLSAGIGGNAADILEKPGVRDSIDCQVEMKGRTRRRLRKFLAAVLLVLGLLHGLPEIVHADEQVWVWAIDISASMDPTQREQGINEMIEVALERAHGLGVQVISVMKFSEEEILADMTWVSVPQPLFLDDCSRVKPELSVTKGLIMLSPSLASGRRQAAVQACLDRQHVERESDSEQRRLLKERLQDATRITPRADVTTRIVPLLQKLLGRPYVRAIEVLTDGIDNSGVPISELAVPDGVPVALIITRPNPRRRSPTLREVLVAAEAWDRIDGVSVTTVSEYAGFSKLAEAR